MQEALEAVERREGASTEGEAVKGETVEREAYLRLLADFENFRKRAQKEKEAAELSGREKILKGFLEILDSFDRGFSNLDKDQESSAVVEGVRMILSQCEHWLRTEGLERIASEGEIFDPSQHEAVSSLEHESVEAGRIIQELRRGYKWNKRLLRAASVVVSKGPATADSVDKVDRADLSSENV